MATNANLVDAVRKGTFSTDLFFRLSEFTIKVPPLRERQDDVVYLARRFVKRTNEHLGKHVSGFSAPAEGLLKTYPWPCNVRQLKSAVRRAVLRAHDVIEPEHFGLDDLQELLPGDDAGHSVLPWTEGMSLKEVVTLNIREIERQAILDALAQSGGNKAKAARLLRIDYTTLHAKIRLYRIQQ